MSMTAEKLAERQHSIGSSDAAAAIGVNPYCTPLQLYLEKIGESEPFEGNVATLWGQRLEDVVAEAYTERTGEALVRAPATLAHPTADFPMTANLDRRRASDDNIVEIKTAGEYVKGRWGEDGSTVRDASSDDIIPPEYITQVHHQMLVDDCGEADVVVLIGGRDLRIYHVEMDVRFAEVLMREEERFWKEHVLPRVPPPPTTIEDIEILFAKDDGSTMIADLDQIRAVSDLRDVKAQIKELTARQKEIEVIVKGAFGNASLLTDNEGNALATYKHQERAGYTVKPTSFRMLRLR